MSSLDAVAAAPQRTAAPRRAPHPEPRPRHLRVVAPAERARRPHLTPVGAVLLSAVVFAVLLALAIAHSVLAEGQVRLDRLDGQLAEEQARYRELRNEVAELESPDRIVSEAHEQGMVTPDDLQYLHPTAPDLSTEGPTAGDDTEPAADPSVGERSEVAWSAIKPLLEEPVP